MKKIGIFLLGAVVVAVVAGLIAGKLLLGYLTPDFLTNQIESNLGCRAEVESVGLSLLGAPHIAVEGLALGPRDRFVEDGTPLSERLPMPYREVQMKAVSLKVHPLDLIKRRLYVQHLTLDGLDAKLLMRRDGTTNMDEIFGKLQEGKSAAAKPAEKEKSETFAAGEIPMAIRADRVEVKNSRVTVDMEATGAQVVLQNAGFRISEIDIDPENLSAHDRAKFQFAGELAVGGRNENKNRVFETRLSGDGEIRPFDPVRGAWDPKWRSSITLAKGSKLDTVPILGKMREALSRINRLGIDLGALLTNGELARDATAEISYDRGRYQFEKPFVLDFADTQLELHAGSWINAASNQHEIKGGVMASELFTREVKEKARKYLADQSNGKISGSLVETLFLPITKDGRLYLEVVSSGDLGQPRADIVTPLGTLGNIGSLFQKSGSMLDDLQKVGKGLLKNLLQKK